MGNQLCAQAGSCLSSRRLLAPNWLLHGVEIIYAAGVGSLYPGWMVLSKLTELNIHFVGPRFLLTGSILDCIFWDNPLNSFRQILIMLRHSLKKFFCVLFLSSIIKSLELVLQQEHHPKCLVGFYL